MGRNMKSRIKDITVLGIMVVFILTGIGKAQAGGCKGLENLPTITMKLHGDDKAKKECKHKSEGAKGTCQGKKNGCQCRAGIETVTVDINDVVRFHGHLCPGSALGYRACRVAFAHLYPGETTSSWRSVYCEQLYQRLSQ